MHIHGMSPALNYGQQVLEGFKVFRTPGDPGGIALFRPDRNAKRFQHSAAVLSMPSVPDDLFLRACRAAVALNADYVPPHDSGWAMYVRPQLYGSSPHLRLTAPDEYKFCVFVIPTGNHLGSQPVRALILDEFDRTAPKGTGHAKIGGNYAPVMRWSDKAKKEGFAITLHLDSKRHEEVDEFSACAFIGVHNNENGDGENSDVTLVIPDSPCIIDSVTSDSVQKIALSFGWNVEKRPVNYSELPSFTEVFGAGTAVALLPIRSITRRQPIPGTLSASQRVRNDEESETVVYLPDESTNGGPVYRKILARLQAIQLGSVEDEFQWRFAVRAEDQELD